MRQALRSCLLAEISLGQWQCTECGWRYKGAKAPVRNCPAKRKAAASSAINLTPILTRLAKLTSHPEILDQPQSYARAAQQWAAGIPGEIEPYETRDDSDVEFIQTLCRSSDCGKHQDGVCRPSCGAGMIVAVKARMATEGCPWNCRRW